MIVAAVSAAKTNLERVIETAKEAYTVFYNIEPTQNNPVNYKEKDIVVKATGKEKNSGLFAAQQTESVLTGAAGTNQLAPTISKQFNKSGEPLITNAPQMATFVTLEAESSEEAAEAVRVYYGAAIVASKSLGVATTNLTEVNAQP